MTTEINHMADADDRAPAGGCYGRTGQWYEGGQFLPTSERPVARDRAPRLLGKSGTVSKKKAMEYAEVVAEEIVLVLDELAPVVRRCYSLAEEARTMIVRGLFTPTQEERDQLDRAQGSHVWQTRLDTLRASARFSPTAANLDSWSAILATLLPQADETLLRAQQCEHETLALLERLRAEHGDIRRRR